MKRTQLNINLDPELLRQIKEAARVSGKSITSFISDCVIKQVGEPSGQSIDSRLNNIERRLQSIEVNITTLLPIGRKITPFTPEEAHNCNQFIKAVFNRELKRQKYNSIKDAWNDLIRHINCFDQWSEVFTFRLKETLFIEHGDPLSDFEMNLLTKGKECPCPIRTGLINWINNSNEAKCCCSDKTFPTQQEICEKGSALLEDL